MVGVALGKSAAEALDVADVGLLKVKARIPAETAVAKDPQSLGAHLGAGWLAATRPAAKLQPQLRNRVGKHKNSKTYFFSSGCAN